MADTPEAIALRIRDFMQAEGQRGARSPAAVHQDGRENWVSEPKTGHHPKDRLLQTYRDCLDKFSDEQCAVLDRIIRAI
jgi:hypothetical protein